MNPLTSVPILSTSNAPSNREAYPRRYRQTTARLIEGRNPVYRRFRHAPLGQAPPIDTTGRRAAQEEDERVELVEGELEGHSDDDVLVEAGESTWLEFADENNPVISEDDPETRPIMSESSVYWVRSVNFYKHYDNNDKYSDTWKELMRVVNYAAW